jgi:hypothetical protein
MTFTCIHCSKPIQGVAAILNKNFIHHRCMVDYKKNNIIKEKWDVNRMLTSFEEKSDPINK